MDATAGKSLGQPVVGRFFFTVCCGCALQSPTSSVLRHPRMAVRRRRRKSSSGSPFDAGIAPVRPMGASWRSEIACAWMGMDEGTCPVRPSIHIDRSPIKSRRIIRTTTASSGHCVSFHCLAHSNTTSRQPRYSTHLVSWTTRARRPPIRRRTFSLIHTCTLRFPTSSLGFSPFQYSTATPYSLSVLSVGRLSASAWAGPAPETARASLDARPNLDSCGR